MGEKLLAAVRVQLDADMQPGEQDTRGDPRVAVPGEDGSDDPQHTRRGSRRR